MKTALHTALAATLLVFGLITRATVEDTVNDILKRKGITDSNGNAQTSHSLAQTLTDGFKMSTGQAISADDGVDVTFNAPSGRSVLLKVNGTAMLSLANNLVTLADGLNFSLGSTTGTKIGTTSSDKLGFFGQSPETQTLAINSGGRVGWGGSLYLVDLNDDLAVGDGSPSGYASKSIRYRKSVAAKTSNYSVQEADSNRTFTTTGAGSTVTFTLPDGSAVPTPKGLQYTFVCNAAQIMTVKAAGSDVIRFGETVTAGGGSYSTTSSGRGSSMSVQLVDTSLWVVTAATGSTWN